MSSQRFPAAWDDDRLASALGSLAADVDWPTVTAGRPDPAMRARVAITERIAERGDTRGRAARLGSGRRSLRWSVVLAFIALVALAAIAGAAILGLPGLRLTLGDPGTPPPTASAVASVPSGTPRPPGAGLELGRAMTLDEARAAVERPLLLPRDPDPGPPDAVYFDRSKGDAVALVWAPTTELPPALDPAVGLLLQTFDGTLHEDYFEKIVGGGATVEPVTVDGVPGYWVSGDPHLFFFNDANGNFIDDGRRWVGDALVWSDGATTYRLESALGLDASLRLAESLE